MVWSLGAAAIAALFVVISTAIVVELQKRAEEDTKRQFETYKLTVEGKVADAKREGIEAGKAAGNALVRAAALEKEAAELRAANLALEAKIQPRRLSSETVHNMTAVLSPYRGTPIVIVSRLFDTEGKDFGDDLASVFNASGWNATRYENWTRSDKGVFIAFVEGTTASLAVAGVVASALDVATIPHKTVTVSGEDIKRMSPHFQPNVPYLLIGAKP